MNTTVVIKTFERPSVVQKLVNSIRQFYPEIPIIVVDDSREKCPIEGVEYVHTDFDIGVSAGRNLGISLCKTKYFFTCDDDNVFTSATDLVKAERLLEENDLDFLGIKEVGNSFYGLFQTENRTVRYLHGNKGSNGEVVFYDFIPNIFLAKVEAAKQYPCDDELKIGEHFAYFYKNVGKIKVGFIESITVNHEPISSPFYAQYRGRALDYVKQFMRQNGIDRRIDLDGNVVDA